MTETGADFTGYLDGYRRGNFEGWAWIPSRPGHRVDIEIVVNGFVLVRAPAADYRADLRAAGIGDGRHAFMIPMEIDTRRSGPVKVVVRSSDGITLGNGEISLGDEPEASEADAAAFKAFVAAVLGSEAPADAAGAVEPPPINFILYAATKAETPVSQTLGQSEYSYGFVMQAFLPLLESYGRVHVVEDPVRDVDLLYQAHLSRGELTVFLSFAPPHKTVMGLRCPTIPVIAWEFPTIPSAVWDDEARHDWRWVLRQLGRAITLSEFAAKAVRASMGNSFPVVAVPAPVWDRHPALQTLPQRSPADPAALAFQGFALDTRTAAFELEMVTPPVPSGSALDVPVDLVLDGVVFTTMLAPQDGRKNWQDLVTAFATAFADRPDATLVLKMICGDAEIWWSKFFDAISRLPKFACRIVVLQGYLDQEQLTALVAASNWVVNASTAEGLCLPLVEFMGGGRPAIAPHHTAMLDYIDETNALIVASDEEYCSWVHDPRNEMTTTRHRVSWASLAACFAEAHRIASENGSRSAGLSQAARDGMRAFCADAVVGAKLDDFLGLGRAQDAEAASSLMRLSAAV